MQHGDVDEEPNTRFDSIRKQLNPVKRSTCRCKTSKGSGSEERAISASLPCHWRRSSLDVDVDVVRIVLYEAPNEAVLRFPVLLPKRKKKKGYECLLGDWFVKTPWRTGCWNVYMWLDQGDQRVRAKCPLRLRSR